MATTGIWPVKADLLALIKYAENPEKTSVMNDDDRHALHQVLAYDMNENKTEEQLYVSGINCLPETAYERMMTTKKQFGKTGGVLAYHGFQSFREGEVTPRECHLIGIETAKKLWGDRFEVVVSSHISGRILHNHFCINSTSFVDGKKFENKYSEHIRLREVSDALCRENGLSVLYGSHFFASQSKREYRKKKTASEIEKEIIRQDILEALRKANDPQQFCWYLRDLGYYINRNWKYEHISVTPPGWNRTVRIDTIIPELTKKRFMDILWDNYERVSHLDEFYYRYENYFEFDFKPIVKHDRRIMLYKSDHYGVKSFVEIVFMLIRISMGLGDTRTKNVRSVVISPSFRKEHKALKEHQAITRFVSKYSVSSPQDIRDAETECISHMEELIECRKLLYNRIRRPKPNDTAEKLKAARDSLTKEIKEAREELKTASFLSDFLARMEKEVDKELALEKSNIPLPEPPTADDASRYINSKYYDHTKHEVQTHNTPRSRYDRER